MSQLVHIFKKDLRGLWGEFAVFLGTLILACWSFPYGSAREGRFDLEGSWAGEMMVLMAGCYLIARLIHAEAIPGSSQFWLTRPYRWPSLLGAKALFILVCAHLPVFIAQAVLLSGEDFPILGNLAGLLWTQVLMLACVSLPAVGIAAVTRGLPGVALFVIGGLAAGASLAYLRVHRVGIIGDGSIFEVVPSNIGVGFLWVESAILAVSLVAAAVPVLYLQYNGRKTCLSRVLLIGILLAGLLLSTFGGLGLTWTIQALASPEAPDTTSFRFSLGIPSFMAARSERGFVPEWPPASFEGAHIDIAIPLLVNGVPAGTDIRTEHVFLSFEGVDGEAPGNQAVDANVLRSGQARGTSGGELRFSLTFEIADGKFYEKLREKPVTVRGYIDLVVIGNERSLSVPKPSFPVNITSAFRCDLKNMRPGKPFSKDLSCRVAFRWPLQSIDVGRASFVEPESFSPFPANLRLNPVLYRYPAFGLSESEQVEFTFREPVSYVRKEFEIHDVQLVEGPGTKTGWR
jgi:hypothetical protein